jgi:hypothetical protein
MKYISLLLLLLLVLLSSCDRYEHNFKAPVVLNFNEVVFSPLQDAFNQSNAADLSMVMDFYADDYLHFGTNKADWELQLRTMISGVPNPVFEVIHSSSMQQNEITAIANWQLKISDPDSKRVIADSTFVGERLVKVSGKWLLKGNQMVCEPPAGKQLVIAEYFTYRTCQNCPPAEAKLKELYLQYPGNFTYLEHHTSGGLEIAGDNTHIYYAAYSPPVSVFNGMDKVTQSTAASLAQYQSLVDSYVQIDTPIRYQIHSTPTVNGRTMTGAVKLTPLIELDQNDMVLNYVIYEEESHLSNITTPNIPLRHVVRAKGITSLAGVNLNNPINISLTSTVDLPEDIKLVVFAQKKPTTFQNNATIYGGLELPLFRKGVK